MQVRLAAAVCQQRKMSSEIVHLFTAGSPAEVILTNCSALESDHMATLLRDVATPRSVRGPCMHVTIAAMALNAWRECALPCCKLSEVAASSHDGWQHPNIVPCYCICSCNWPVAATNATSTCTVNAIAVATEIGAAHPVAITTAAGAALAVTRH